jgi:ferredoxin/Na+-translocating ferredoxin:NAD+ oxidoreductase RnfG subunit
MESNRQVTRPDGVRRDRAAAGREPSSPLVRVYLLLLLALIGAAVPGFARAQSTEITQDLLERVFPSATSFSEKEGSPPVWRAFATDPETGAEVHAGFVVLTSDVPPETVGYTAPIEVLVGMDLAGTLTGARVIEYRESLKSSRGDFLGKPGIQSQFTGKTILDDFRVRRDVQPVTGATITMIAMATGVRNAGRRVAAAYMSRGRQSDGPPPKIGEISVDELARLTWPEIVALGMTAETQADVGGNDLFRVSVMYLRDAALMEAVLGPTRYPVAARATAELTDTHLMFFGLNGPTDQSIVLSFPADSIFFVQHGETIRLGRTDNVSTGLLPDGKAGGAFRRTGILLVPTTLDVREPFTVGIGAGGVRAESNVYAAYDPPTPALAEAATDSTPTVLAGATANGSEDGTNGVADVAGAPAAIAEGDAVAPGALTASIATSAGAQPGQSIFDFTEEDLAGLLAEQDAESASLLASTIAQTSWPRVAGLLVVLSLATAAFLSKRTAFRWVALAVTIGFLGFVDRGFLSVSHILAAISSGPSVFLSDLSLLIIVVFTVLTTIFVGRVFCGYLCPFGAIQDVLDRAVPRRFRRELPRAIHERALWVKYGILALVLAPAVLHLPFTLYHWFEPFGTVFFWSPSIALWSIALGILVASAIVPRFYCRYMCPLGASLAIGSLMAPFRIRRVEQCKLCTVCERTCPTGAIKKERIDFKECVRCNACETKLIEKAGVCRHDIEKIRPRLVQIEASARKSA